ncbi:MAG: lactate utilization protein [Spirochaetales bacterium]|nr:lactate utilization protein [Spirochaetales bacterium]
MDEHLYTIRMKAVQQTIEQLRKNNMEALFVPTIAQVKTEVKARLPKGATVAVGGSVSLAEAGILELLRNGDYAFLDRYAPALTGEDVRRIYIASFSADVYLSSVNAITEHGELYCVDGTGNRVAALLYGPKEVIILASWDKIVPDLAHAAIRVKHVAAPANATRLKKNTHCTKQGHCISAKLDPGDLMALKAGQCPETICASYVVLSNQRIKNRITVLIVGESLGY